VEGLTEEEPELFDLIKKDKMTKEPSTAGQGDCDTRKTLVKYIETSSEVLQVQSEVLQFASDNLDGRLTRGEMQKLREVLKNEATKVRVAAAAEKDVVKNWKDAPCQ
jgi:hypothetical protein